jgi:hypothetical protein
MELSRKFDNVHLFCLGLKYSTSSKDLVNFSPKSDISEIIEGPLREPHATRGLRIAETNIPALTQSQIIRYNENLRPSLYHG